ncbi:hypothetical protein R1sor_027486 [Riccia sorocarpa]|uniref:Uncharacterized protein n=1 Tax=Riccia sorocarpa TaxID=122646 RepID=A0ABD3GED1_9MARC
MGWTWTCFGGRKESVRRLNPDGRVRHKNGERLDSDTQIVNPSRNPSLATQNTTKLSARDTSAYEELFQPKQVVCGSLQGTKLFRRKTVRRNNSLGSSPCQNEAKKHTVKKGTAKAAEGDQSEVLVDQLQEEVETLRKKLAEEEAESRKLRNEVVYLRSCGVLQSPERISCGSIGRDSPSPGSFKDDRAQRHLQSWLGLTLSPSSRSNLEDQLRSMAAEEISKNPGKGLTNGQKALIVATRLWHYQAEDASQMKFESRDSYSPDTSSCFGNNLIQNQGTEDLLPQKDVHAEGGESKQISKDAPLAECDEESTLNAASFRQSLELRVSPDRSFIEERNIKAPLSYETHSFSFHPSSGKPPIEDETVIRKVASLSKQAKLSAREVEQIDSEFERYPAEADEHVEEEMEKCPVEEQVKFESPRRSSVPLNSRGAVPASHDARLYAGRQYDQVEEKLSRSPNSRTAAPNGSHPQPICDTLPVEDSDSSLRESDEASSPETELFPLPNSAPNSAEVTSDEDSPTSPSTPVLKTFFSARSGRMWQPLSPVKEVDSERSSVRSSVRDSSSVLSSRKDLTETDERGFSRESWSSETRSSSKSPLSSSQQEGNVEESFTTDGSVKTSDAPENHHFTTVASSRLNHQYDPRDDDRHFQADDSSNGEADTSVERSTTTNWTTSEDSLYSDDDILPIQCQSPDLSPQPLRSKFAKKAELKVEYPRDKYLRDAGLKVEELLLSSESFSTGPLDAQKEHLKSVESFTVMLEGHPAAPVYKLDGIPSSDAMISRDGPHPVLASIENLPTWIEHQGICVGSAKKGQLDVSVQAVKEEKGCTKKLQDVLVCVENQTKELSSLDIHQVEEEQSRPFYFDISDIERKEFFARNSDENPHHSSTVKYKNHRYSVSGDEASHILEGEITPSKNISKSSPASASQDEVECLLPSSGEIDVREYDAYSSTKRAVDVGVGSGAGGRHYSPRAQGRDSSVEVEADFAEKFIFKNAEMHAGHQGASAVLDFRLRMRSLDEAGEIRILNRDRVDPADNSVTSESSSSEGSVEETESLGESCSSNELRSPEVSKNSDAGSSFSRMTDGIDQSIESTLFTPPSSTKRSHETSFTYQRDSLPATEVEPHSPVRGLPSISPDDRPILGTVAAWWGSESSKSRAWWDGQGIPNSTSKYKEDQRVSWHTTPFETRLERALATQATTPTDLAMEGVLHLTLVHPQQGFLNSEL